MRLVEYHVKDKWVTLYIKRCLTAPIQMMNSQILERKSGALREV